MKKNFLQQADDQLRKRHKGRVWKRGVTGMAAVVVFVTTYMLILPAITMETETVCGLEEHTHTESCYKTETVLGCTLQETPGQLLCALEEQPQQLICGQEEQPALLVCMLEESADHTHSAECYDPATGHTHSESCYAPGHTHGPECYDASTAHTHGEGCYTQQQVLACALTEHTHSESCYPVKQEPAYTCGQQEHIHSDACYTGGTLTCAVPEHTHGAGCLTATVPPPETTAETGGSKLSGKLSSLLSALSGAQSIAVDAAARDMKNDITDASYSGPTYNAATNSIELKFTMDFTSVTSDIIAAGHQYYYDLPAGVTVPDELLNMPAPGYNGYDADGTLGFHYRFVKNENGDGYRIEILFDEAYIAKAGTEVSCKLEFNASLGADSQQENGNLQTQFNQNVTVTIPTEEINYPDNETLNYDLSASKSATSKIETDGDYIYYTVTVKSDKGTPNPIVLTDTLTANGTTLDSIEVQSVETYSIDQWGNENSDKTPVDTNSYSCTADPAAGKLNMTLPALQPNGTNGQGYKIVYKVKISDVAVNSAATVGNTVNVSAADSEKGETVTSTASKSVTVDKQYTVGKYGSYDSSSNKINWQLTVNSNQIDIGGAHLTDDMFANVSAADIKISPSDGKYTIVPDENGNVAYIEFKEGCTSKYYISYSTSPEISVEGGTITNNASFDKTPSDPNSGDEVSAGHGVKVSGSTLTKTFTSATAPNETGLIEVTWNTRIDIPGGELPVGAKITDTLQGQWEPNAINSDRWFTREQIVAWGSYLAGETANGDYAPGLNYWWPDDPTLYNIVVYDANNNAYGYSDLVANSNIPADAKFYRYEIVFPNGLTREQLHDATSLHFAYKCWIDTNNVSDTSAKYGNRVELLIPEGDTFKQVNVAYADYTYKVRVVKTDGNGSTSSSNISTTTDEGKLVWKVNISPDSEVNTMTITDTLPEGVSLTALKLSYLQLALAENGTISGSLNGVQVTGSVTGQDVVVTLTLPEGTARPDWMKPGSTFTLEYTCKMSAEKLAIPEDQNSGDPADYSNRVTVTADGAEFGSDAQTQTVTVHRPQNDTALKPLTKNGTWDNNNRRVDYQVIINPGANDLKPDSDTLELADDFTYFYNDQFPLNATLLPATVKLYYCSQNENGEWVEGIAVEPDKWNWRLERSEAYGTVNSIIRANVPDKTAMMLKYSYELWLPPDFTVIAPVQVQNSATLNGDEANMVTVNGRHDWKNQATSGSITTEKTFTFYKIEQGNYANTLAGAEFTLYEYNGTEFVATEKVYTTSSSGSFNVSWNDGYTFKNNTAYYVVETKAPDGYLMPDSPQKYYFSFGADANAADAKLPNDWATMSLGNLNVTNHTAYCENIPNRTSITVNKQWFAQDGAPITDPTGSISFTMYRDITAAAGGSSSNTGNGGDVNITLNFKKTSWGAESTVSSNTITCTAGSRVKLDMRTKWTIPTSVTVNNTSVSQASTWTETNTPWYQYLYTTSPLYSDTVLDICMTVDDSHSENLFLTHEVIEPSAPEPEPEAPSVSTTRETVGTYTLSAANNWSLTLDSLPKSGTDANGNPVTYYYSVEETVPSGYTVSYDNNGGIPNGTIVINNTSTGETPAPPRTWSVTLSAAKRINDAPAAFSEGSDYPQFIFIRREFDADNMVLQENGEYKQVIWKNDTNAYMKHDGSIVWDDVLTFTEPGDYWYTIFEKPESWLYQNENLLTQMGYHFDTCAYLVKVHIDENSANAATTYYKVDHYDDVWSADKVINYDTDGRPYVDEAKLTPLNEAEPVIFNNTKDTPNYTLPETGGEGTLRYTASGLLLITAAAALAVYKEKKRRKGAKTSD